MPYGKLRRLLSNEYQTLDEVLIESAFIETTRKGKRINPVRLALTPDTLIVASETTTLYVSKSSKELIKTSFKKIELRHLYPLELVQMKVFKQSQRLTLKMCIANKVTKYFELGLIHNREVLWKLWCSHAATTLKTLPRTVKFNQQHNSISKKKLQWKNKWLYLGSKRENEDKDRPIPVPGLGPTEEIKLWYLKQQYFGCWDQSEHWVQCESSGSTIFNR